MALPSGYVLLLLLLNFVLQSSCITLRRICVSSVAPNVVCTSEITSNNSQYITGLDVEMFRFVSLTHGWKELVDYEFVCINIEELLASLLNGSSIDVCWAGLAALAFDVRYNLTFSYPYYRCGKRTVSCHSMSMRSLN
jgi:hypothetical protein